MSFQTDPAGSFSLVEGGPLYRLAQIAGLTGGVAGLVRIGLALSFFTWLPLAVLTLIPSAPASEPSLPFMLSVGTHVRLLIAIPLLFVAEAMFDVRVREAIRLIVETRLVPEHQRTRLIGWLQQAMTLRDAWHVEAALLLLTIVLVVWGFRQDLSAAIPSWQITTGGQRTAAGWWYVVVAIPLFQFLFLRWCARMLIWWYVLWRIGQLDLHLIPTHPDLAGGLGVFGVAQMALLPITLSYTAILVGTLTEEIWYAGARVQDYVLPLTGIVAAGALVVALPLLRFTVRLFDVRQRGLLEYGALATTYVRAFDDKWLRPGAAPAEPLLGSADVQSLADLASSFGVIKRMRALPLSPIQALAILILPALPAVPLVLFVAPFDELILRGLQTLLHL
jgi:hypothetical protein